ncbi:MAG: AmmeMemoRadiSam system protein B [Chlorobium sp.]|nr:MAG: AmmeMemoRadiSam system protein B [Chlorobium sp.]
MNLTIRYPAVADSHYPADSEALELLMQNLLDSSGYAGQDNRKIRAILSPHAPLDISGKIAAEAYKVLKGKKLHSIFLLGNTHAFFFDGVAADSRHEWLTPLGSVPVNRSLTKELCSVETKNIRILDLAHDMDHVLELQLPFLQRSLEKGFSIVPILLGTNTDNVELADLLRTLFQPDDLIVVSTDLSHYPTYRQAIVIDNETMESIVNLDMDRLEAHQKKLEQTRKNSSINLSCSPDAIITLLLIARKLGWKAERLSYTNTGFMPDDDKTEVVGYGSIIFYEETAQSKE